MKKILLGCAITMFTSMAFAAVVSTDTSRVAMEKAQSDQITEFNEQVYYVLLDSKTTAEELSDNMYLKNIKLEKRPLPMKPVPEAQ